MSDEPAPRVIWSPRGNRAQVRLLKCQVFEIFFGGARGGGMERSPGRSEMSGGDASPIDVSDDDIPF